VFLRHSFKVFETPGRRYLCFLENTFLLLGIVNGGLRLGFIGFLLIEDLGKKIR
jgi:hypothetical protein